MRRVAQGACCLAVLLIQALEGATGDQEISAGTDRATAVWSSRLEALHPSRPMEYFELAEEVADEAGDEAGRDLARRLFGLAGILDPEGLARSAALAQADLAAEDGDRRLNRLGILFLGDLVALSEVTRLLHGLADVAEVLELKSNRSIGRFQ